MSLVRFRFWARRCSSMVEHQPSKLNTWVRFPSPALRYRFYIKCASGSVGGARPCQGRGRGFESRLALYTIRKAIPYRDSLSYWARPRSSFHFGRCKTVVPRTTCFSASRPSLPNRIHRSPATPRAKIAGSFLYFAHFKGLNSSEKRK